VDYTSSPFGRFDPALLSQLRKRIATAKDTWSGLAGGDAHKLKGVRDQFAALGETLMKLYPGSEPLARAMSAGVETVVTTSRAPSPELGMEVATAILYLEAAFQDLDPNDQQLADRTARLAERLMKVVKGGQPEPLEHWVEDLYRRVSDKQTMGSVGRRTARHHGRARETARPVLPQSGRQGAPARRTELPRADARRAVGAGPGPRFAGRAAHARHGREHHRDRGRRGAGARRRHLREAGQQPGRAGLPDRHAELPAVAREEAVPVGRRAR
jgi:hypothetical protein